MAGRHRRRAGSGGGFLPLLQLREFRAVFLANALSLAGDQVARLALAVLVFERSQSAALTAATYAVTFLPWLVAAPLLSGLGDRFPRRTVLVATDLVRAALAASLALPRLPLPVLFVLVFLLTSAEPPFVTARSALLPDILGEGDRYALGHSLMSTLGTLLMVVGFGAGGVLVAAVGTTTALLLDAATFLVSAVLLLTGVRRRAAPRATEGAPGAVAVGRGPSGMAVVLGDRRARWIVLLAAGTAAFDVVASGLAVPWSHQLGAGSAGAGLLSAAGPAGTVVGSLVLARYVRGAARLRLMPWLALLAVAPFTVALLHPGLAAATATLALGGVGCAFQLVANQTFVQVVPAALRSRAFGVAAGTLMVGQGLALVGAGGLAERVAPSDVVGWAGVGGVLVVLGLWARRPDLGEPGAVAATAPDGASTPAPPPAARVTPSRPAVSAAAPAVLDLTAAPAARELIDLDARSSV